MDSSTKGKIIYIGILRDAQPEPIELCCERELSSYSRFTRASISEFTTMFSKILAGRIKPGNPEDVEEKEFTFHVRARAEKSEGTPGTQGTQIITGIVISNDAYPSRVAHALLNKILDEFIVQNPNAKTASGPVPFPALKDYIIQSQDPRNVDAITDINEQLNETKTILHKTIESVLERGQKIDHLVQKSEDLSAQSKMFYTSAKKQNSCCIIM